MARLKLNRRKARRFRYIPDNLKRSDNFENLASKGFYVYSNKRSEENIVSHLEMENFFRGVGR